MRSSKLVFFTIPFSRAFHIAVSDTILYTHLVSIHRELMNVLHIIVWDYLLWFIIGKWKSSALRDQCVSAMYWVWRRQNKRIEQILYIEWLVLFYINMFHFLFICIQLMLVCKWTFSLCIVHAWVVLCF